MLPSFCRQFIAQLKAPHLKGPTPTEMAEAKCAWPGEKKLWPLEAHRLQTERSVITYDRRMGGTL